MDQHFSADPHRWFSQLRSSGPVHRVTITNGTPVWLVIGHAEAHQVLEHHDLFRKNIHALRERLLALTPPGQTPLALPPVVEALLNQDPPDHTRLRGLVTKAFTPRRVHAFAPAVREFTSSLLDRLNPSDEVDLVDALAAPLPIMVISFMLGVPEEDRDAFAAWTADFVQADDPERAWTAGEQMGAYLADLLARKRQAGGDDLLTDLIRVHDGGDRLSDDELISLTFVLLLAGHETTVHLIAGTVLALMQHPDALAQVSADDALIPAAMDETLRWDGPLHTATYRYAHADITLADVPIAAGDLVFVALGAAGRDPLVYPDPDTFDLHRENKRSLAFGQGIHYCLGAALARMEVAIALEELLRRWPTISLARPHEQLVYKHMLLQRSLERLPVHLSSANSFTTGEPSNSMADGQHGTRN